MIKKYTNIKTIYLSLVKLRASMYFFFFSSYNVWKHVRYHVLISRNPGEITQFR